jgi:hypothetical protein
VQNVSRKERSVFKERNVAKLVGVMICTLAIVCSVSPSIAGDQEDEKAVTRSPDFPDDLKEAKALQKELAAAKAYHDFVMGPIPRYLVTYMESVTAWTNRSATVVTVTNQSSQPCKIRVAWYRGFVNAPYCTTEMNLAAHMTSDFCSRDLPQALTTCNSTCSPELMFHEGRAIVASTCKEIGVSARVYYTTGRDDSTLTAITDSKVVRWSEGNNGD